MFHEMNKYAKFCILMQNENRVNSYISVSYKEITSKINQFNIF